MTSYVLTAPLSIGPRLIPSIAIDPERATGGRLSAWITGYDGDKARVSYFVDFPGGEYYGNDVALSPRATRLEPGETIREALAVLCGYLTAEAEAYQATMGASEPVDGWLFSAAVAEWAYLNSDELSMAALDLRGDEG